MDINTIWNNILKNEGQKFYTVRDKIEFHYVVNQQKTSIQPYPVNGSKIQAITRTTVGKVLNIYGIPKKTSQLNDKWRAPAYIFAIMTDPRISNGNL